MSNLFKFLFISCLCALMQACAGNMDIDLYQAKPGPTSTLVLNIPEQYDNSASMEARDPNGNMKFLYGMNIDTRQSNKRIKINANQDFNFYLTYKVYGNYICNINASFIPEPGVTYYLSTGTDFPKSTGFWERLISDNGTCFMQVTKLMNGHVVYVKLNK